MVDLELHGWGVKKLIRGTLGESYNNQEDHPYLRSQGCEKIVMVNGIGKNLVKEEEREKGNGRDLMSAPMKSLGTETIEKIDITKIVTGRRTGRGRENVDGTRIVTETVHVIVIEAGTVVVIMIVTVTKTVVGIMIVIAIVRGIMKLVTLIVGIPVIETLIMTVLTQNMRGVAMLTGTMIMLS